MTATPQHAVLLWVLFVLMPSVARAQQREAVPAIGLSTEQWVHWSGKLAGTAASWVILDALEVPPDVSPVLATITPTVVGKLIYLPKGLGRDPDERWPDATFVVRDVMGEMCVQSAPLWIRFVTHDREHRVLRGIVAAGGYGLAVLGCARALEVR